MAATAVAANAVRRLAIQSGSVVAIRPDRWHSEPTPTFGGVAIFAVVLTVIVVAAGLGVVGGWAQAFMVMLGAAAMFAMGVMDDRRNLPPLPRLLAALVAGALVLFGLSAAAGVVEPWWKTIILVILFGGTVHAFNQVDNMDGVAGGLSLVAAVAFVVVFGDLVNSLAVVLLTALGGAMAGFLIWNVKPARLFMGNCGSFFAGAILAGAGLSVVVRPGDSFWFDGLAVCFILLVPITDTVFVAILRGLAGRNATRGGTDHLSHRLVRLGLSERSAAATLHAIALVGATSAWFVHRNGSAGLAVAAIVLAAMMVLGVYAARVPSYDGDDFKVLQQGALGPFLRDLTLRWHAFELLLDTVLIAAVMYLAYRLRFWDERFEMFLPMFTTSLPLILACKLLALYVSGVYDRMWGFFGIADLLAIVRGVVFGSVGTVFLAAYLDRFERFSRGVFVIDGVLLTAALVTARILFKTFGESTPFQLGRRSKRALVYGAGAGGQLLIRELRANPSWEMAPVAVVDDDKGKHRKLLLGVRVVGGLESLELALDRYHVDEVVLSVASLKPETEDAVRRICQARAIAVRRFRVGMSD